ncbi:unnamed protein product [Bemisia tabaci]|uniref:Tryptophan synthase beta chain-like PALP domain-containing protein n=1 Tax=Bemisia tabaci TaxID=7038 RepID=A0A9P0AHA1_BEMTA|nr:unnamed protein product [Bemisia tabaci]
MSLTGDKAATNRALVTLSDIQDAHERIKPFVHRTPLLTSGTLDALATRAVGASHIRVRLAFKSEHLQRVGAFKMRGATNAVRTHLAGAGASGTLWAVTHSSGNHAAAVASAARAVGARAAVVMPRTAPPIKKAAVADYGARIVDCEPTQAAREAAADRLIQELQAQGHVVKFVHPYDDELVIAGQGTLGLEMLEQAVTLGARGDDEPVLDMVVAPVGGGGMLSGVSAAVKGVDPRILVIGAEPEMADDAARSLESGVLQPAVTPPRTICDGLLTALSPLTLAHLQAHVGDVLTASEGEILAATRLVWERMKQLIEPSAAVGLAVVLNSPRFAQHVRRVAELRGDGAVEVRVGVVWTGGNVELASVVEAMNN